MKKTALIFPGQGSQYVGMAKDLFEEFSSVREMFGLASDILKADLADVCFNGPEEKLKQTAFTQPAVFVHSCALDMILRENYIVASAAAGHSLGEFTALVSAGALSFDSAIRTIARRCAAMQEDCEKSPGTMAAIMGLPYESVERILRDVIGVIASANYNAPDQVVISGDRNAVEAACAKLKEAGAKRAIILQVAGAYHSPLMSHSAEVMMDYIAGMSFGEFSFPVYSNVGAEPVTDGAVFKELLARQIISPVLWYPILLNMQWDGVRRFVEVGPGKVLQGLVRRSLDDPEMEFDGIDTLDDLDNFINQYARVSHE